MEPSLTNGGYTKSKIKTPRISRITRIEIIDFKICVIREMRGVFVFPSIVESTQKNSPGSQGSQGGWKFGDAFSVTA